MEQSLDIKITPLSLLKFAFPTMIANLFMSIYMTIDGIFVANCVNTNALSAVNIVMPYVMIVLALGTMIGTGGSAIVSSQLGEGRIEEAKENFSFLSLICFVACIAVSALTIVFHEPLLHMLGANDVIYDYCVDYVTPLFVIAPLALLGMALQSFFIAAGKPGLGMTFSLMGGVVNIFLDWLFIARFGWETTGAALATGIGYSIPGVAGIIYFTVARKGTLYFVKPKWRKKVLLNTITNGSSEMVAMTASGITTVMMNNIIMGVKGEDGVAAISILIYTMSLLTAVYMGYALGVAPITSYNYGAGNSEKLKKEHGINLRIIAITSAVMYLVGIVLRTPLISIFAEKGTAVFDMAAKGYWLFSISYLYMGFNMYSSSLFTALGDGKTSAIISFCRGFIFLTITLYGLSSLFGLSGLYLAMPVTELLGLGLTVFYLKKLKGKYKYA